MRIGWLVLLLAGAARGDATGDFFTLKLREASARLREAPTPAGRYLAGVAAQESGELAAAWDAYSAGLGKLAKACNEARACDDVLGLALARRLDTLVGEVERPRAAEALAALPARGLGAEATRRVTLVRAQLARRAGDEKGALALEQAAGCPPRVWVAGPFGRLPRLDLETSFAVERPGFSEWRQSASRACQVLLDGPRGHAGVIYGATWVEAPADGRVVVHVDTEAAWRLFVDGQAAWSSVEPRRYPPRMRRVELRLGRGWHQILLKAAAPGGRIELGFAVENARLFDGATPPATASAAPKGVRELPAATLAPGALPALLAVEAALAFGDSELGERALTQLRAAAPKLAISQLFAAQLALSDPSRPAQFAQDRARVALELGLSMEPALARARNLRVQMSLNADRAKEALARLTEAPPSPYWRFEYLRYQAYRARGWTHDAQEALARAQALHPGACALMQAEVVVRKERHDVAGALAAAKRASRCEGGSDEYADALRDQHDNAGAARELERLLVLDPNRQGWWSSLVDALVAERAYDKARAVLRELIRKNPRATHFRRELADAEIALGDEAAARRTLEAGLAEAPESQELGRALEALCDRSRGLCGGVDDYRVDGRRVIADYVAAGRPAAYQAPAVIVLDRTVTRVFPTGGRLTLTHNIIQVQQKSGIDRWGEVQIPDGADILTLRTVKADGTTREPEDLSGKEAVSAPDLEVGDFVEFEYVESSAPPAAFPGGFLAERFYFRSFEAPLDRSEYVLVTPPGMALVFDKRGAPPEATLATHKGVEVRTFSTRNCPQVFAEPGSVPYVEYLPSVRAAANVTLAGWRDYLRDSVFNALRANDELRRVAEREAARGQTLEAKVEAINHWVRRNIKGAGQIDEAATAALARGEGNRLVVIMAMLRAVGIDSELWLARDTSSAHLEGPLPDLEVFDEPVLAVKRAGGPLFVEARHRHAATGFLSPVVRGQPALPLRAGPATLETLPDSNKSDDRQLAMEVTLDAAGGADIDVKERLRGWPAVEWREALDRLAGDRIRPEFEQRTLGFYFPSSTLIDLDWQRAEEDTEELTIHYHFRVTRLGRQVGRAWVLPAPYPALLGRRYVGVNTREAALAVDYAAPTHLSAHIRFPAGVTVELPGPVALSGFGVFEQSSDKRRGADGRDEVTVRGAFELPRQRVPPARYGAFVDYATAVDRAEARMAEMR